MNQETVLVLRNCKNDLTSFGGFQWKESGIVEAPDFIKNNECGNGLHGFLWGEGDSELANWYSDSDAKWLVVKVNKDDIIELFGKVKFPKGEVVFCGNLKDATDYIIQNGAKGKKVIGANVTSSHNQISTTGDYGTSISGNCGTSQSLDYATSKSEDFGYSISEYHGTSISGSQGTSISKNNGTSISGNGGKSTSGNYGKTISGDFGISSTGDYGTSISGNYGKSSSEYSGVSITGDYGTSQAGCMGIVKAGKKGTLILKYYSHENDRFKLAIAFVGENEIKPNTCYQLDRDNNFQEVKEEWTHSNLPNIQKLYKEQLNLMNNAKKLGI